MKLNWIRRNINSIKFTILLSIIGIIIGIILFNTSNETIKQEVINKIAEITSINNPQTNNIIYHIIIISVLSFLSLTVIGNIPVLFYYFYEFISVGYLLTSFYSYKKITGLLYGCIYLVINKTIFLLLLTYLIINSLKYSKFFINNFKASKTTYLVNHLYKCMFVIIVAFINDVIISLISNNFLSLFNFLR